MAGSLAELVRDLKGFEARKEVTRQLRKELRAPIPGVRAAIRRRALATMPRRGGLNRWVAQVRVTAAVKFSGRSAGVRLKGGRNSTGGRSDIRAIDRGRVRAPSWGRRSRGAWHNQTVPAGFFTGPATEVDQWRDACVKAVDNALETISRG
jgi:hypothetical protein